MNLELTEEEAGQQGDYRAKPPRAGDLQCHRPSARVFAEHDSAATAWRGECRQRRLCPNPDLPCAAEPRSCSMLSVYTAVRVRPFPKMPPLKQNGCGPSTRTSPA